MLNAKGFMARNKIRSPNFLSLDSSLGFVDEWSSVLPSHFVVRVLLKVYIGLLTQMLML